MRDVRERGRDIEGCIKQWFSFVKPNFHRYVSSQREVAGALKCLSLLIRIKKANTRFADIIVPRGVENRVAIGKLTSFTSHYSFSAMSMIG